MWYTINLNSSFKYHLKVQRTYLLLKLTPFNSCYKQSRSIKGQSCTFIFKYSFDFNFKYNGHSRWTLCLVSKSTQEQSFPTERYLVRRLQTVSFSHKYLLVRTVFLILLNGTPIRGTLVPENIVRTTKQRSLILSQTSVSQTCVSLQLIYLCKSMGYNEERIQSESPLGTGSGEPKSRIH